MDVESYFDFFVRYIPQLLSLCMYIIIFYEKRENTTPTITNKK